MKSLTFAALVFVLFVEIGPAFAAPEPPGPPASGPGSLDYAHQSLTVSSYGEGVDQYWIFEPDQPKPASAPVIVFNHGWGVMEPSLYGAWIEHLVRRGNIVIYPRFQAKFRQKGDTFSENAIKAVQDALNRLKTEGGHVQPELNHFAVVGHSAGAVVTANMASVPDQLPAAAAVMCVEPGETWNKKDGHMTFTNLAAIPAGTLLVVVVGDKDTIVKDIDGKQIFKDSTQVPAANKNYVEFISDNHGSPALKATHGFPAGYAADGLIPVAKSGFGKGHGRKTLVERMRERRAQRNGDDQIPTSSDVNALDFNLWKLFDGLCDAAFYGKNREYALGNTPQQRSMGQWSDGAPVKELKVTTTVP